MVKGIDAAALRALLNAGSGVTVLDVRSEDEVREQHVDPGRGVLIQLHIDVFREQPHRAVEAVQELESPSPVVVVCWEGACSVEVAEVLAEEDFEVYYLEGGIEAW